MCYDTTPRERHASAAWRSAPVEATRIAEVVPRRVTSSVALGRAAGASDIRRNGAELLELAGCVPRPPRFDAGRRS